MTLSSFGHQSPPDSAPSSAGGITRSSMNPPKEGEQLYKLRSFSDVMHMVPTHKMEACMADISAQLIAAKRNHDAMVATAKRMGLRAPRLKVPELLIWRDPSPEDDGSAAADAPVRSLPAGTRYRDAE